VAGIGPLRGQDGNVGEKEGGKGKGNWGGKRKSEKLIRYPAVMSSNLHHHIFPLSSDGRGLPKCLR
jgi:hypothetical protein